MVHGAAPAANDTGFPHRYPTFRGPGSAVRQETGAAPLQNEEDGMGRYAAVRFDSACQNGMNKGLWTVEHLDNAQALAVSAVPEGDRYPGVGKMFLLWTAIGALTVARSQLPGSYRLGHENLANLLACTSWYFPWAVLSPLVFRLERRLPLGALGWPRRVGLLAAISVPFCVAASLLMMVLYVAVRYALGEPGPFFGGLRFWLWAFPSAEGLFWCSVGGGYFFRTLFQLHEQEQRAARLALERSRLEASLNQAQLDALRSRLNPHFLFNSLQNISVLTKQDPQTASRMLTVLGDLLRAVLRRDSEPEITVAEELDLTRSYVSLEQMRFGDRLRVTFEIADDAHQALAPSFLMQPLIENAIIHGLRGVRKTGVIVVRVSPEDGKLVITIVDNGIGPPSDSTGMKLGVGLGATCERLTKMYAERQSFSIRKPAEGGAEVRIEIPLRYARSVNDAWRHEEIPAAHR
jgi:two-component system LytT family sensor kinase